MRLKRDERKRILAGDVAPIRRAEDPEAKVGEKIILLWSKEERRANITALDEERARQLREGKGPELPGDIIKRHISITPAAPLVVLTVTAQRRRTKGGFAVAFDLYDAREKIRMPRRVPPARAIQADEKPLTEDERKRAAEESGYTSAHALAVDEHDAVPTEYQNVLVTRAKDRFATHRSEERAEERAREDVTRITARLKAAAISAARCGVSVDEVFMRWERDLAELEKRSEEAA